MNDYDPNHVCQVSMSLDGLKVFPAVHFLAGEGQDEQVIAEGWIVKELLEEVLTAMSVAVDTFADPETGDFQNATNLLTAASSRLEKSRVFAVKVLPHPRRSKRKGNGEFKVPLTP